MKAIILFAHGSRYPDWAQPIHAIRDAMQARQPGIRVEVAFLEFIAPLLPDAIDMLVDAGYKDIAIVPIFMAQSGHTKRDLPTLLDAARTRHADLTVDISTPVGEVPTVVAAIAEYALSLFHEDLQNN